MSDTPVISAETRDRAGKGAARSTRREGNVPGVIYGDNKDPQLIKLAFHTLNNTVNRGGFMKTVFDLDMDGKKTRVIPKDLQVDPVMDHPIHVDFMRVRADTQVAVNVPVAYAGEEECPGLVRGGVLNVVRFEVELLVPANAIPETIIADLTVLDIGDSVRISDIKLPDNCKPTIIDRDFIVVTIAAPTIEAEPEDEDGVEEIGADEVPTSAQSDDDEASDDGDGGKE